MALMSTLTPGLLTTYQTYFCKEVLKIAIPLTVLDQFAVKQVLPKNVGATTIRFYQPPGPDATKVQALTEGVAPTQYRETTLNPIDVPLTQRGEVAKTTDILNATGLFNFLKMTSELMAADAALDVDTRIRIGLIAAGQTPFYNGAAGGPAQSTVPKRYAQGIQTYAGLVAANQAAGRMVVNDLLDGMTRLKLNRAPMKNGLYNFIGQPQQTRDLMDDDKYVKLSQYSKPDLIMKGEVGNLYGCRVVETTNAQIETTTEGTYDATGNAANSIYTGILTGTNAYGIVELAGSGPNAPKMIICDTPDKLDPLNQTTTFGWKAFWAFAVLNPSWMCFIRSKSNFNN